MSKPTEKKTPKRPIDIHREAACFMNVGDENDQSAIVEVAGLPNAMCVIKEQGIWRVQLADNVDPERTNPRLPNTSQKLVARGSTDPLACQIFLQAKRLLDPSVLPRRIDTERGLQVALDFLIEMDALRGIVNDFEQVSKVKNEEFDTAKRKDNALRLPSIGDISQRGKAFCLAGDRCVRSTFDIIRLFYPQMELKKGWFRRFGTVLLTDGNADAGLRRAVDKYDRSFQLLRSVRNAIEHPKDNQRVIFHDYDLTKEGSVYAPSLELIDKSTPLERTDLAMFMTKVFDLLASAFEEFLVELCERHAEQRGQEATIIVELPRDRRRYEHVRYGYAIKFQGQYVPLG